MSKKISLKKTCSIYASDLHLATMIFPFINKEIEEHVMIKTILENDIGENIENIIYHTCLNTKMKKQIKQIDWTKTNIEKIKETLKEIEEKIDRNSKIDIIISGSNVFIDKVNYLIDLWVKANLEEIERKNKVINIINCYNFEQNNKIDNIMQKHEYILKTTGIEQIYQEEMLKKAN